MLGLKSKHLSTVCMGYFHHLRNSLYYSRRFFFASIKAVIHALVPDLYITSTTDTVTEIDELLKINYCK